MTKEEIIQQAAELYASKKSSSSVFQKAHIDDFIAGANWIEQSKWIKIESENDLPKERINWVVKDDEIVCIELKKPINFKKLWSDFKKYNITHYQPIQKPEPPIC